MKIKNISFYQKSGNQNFEFGQALFEVAFFV